MIFLEDGDVARVDVAGTRVVNAEGAPLDRQVHRILWDAVAAEKGGYRHFMAKEIHEQPTAIAETLGGKVSLETGELYLDSPLLSPERVAKFDRVLLLACGTSWHAGLVGKFLIEGMARIPVEVDYGSEFRYRRPVVNERTLTIGISQSGETADTVAALSRGAPLRVADRRDRQRPRQPDRPHGRGGLRHARGPRDRRRLDEGLHDAARRPLPDRREAARLARPRARPVAGGAARRSRTCPRLVGGALAVEPELEELARRYQHARDFLYLGRGLHYPVALEGALKLKEISYIHAEGYPAGEMKHGPIALIDENMPVIVLAPHDAWREKTLSNLREVKSRDGIAIVLGTRPDAEVAAIADHVVIVPETIPELQPILSVVPLQLFAYHVAVRSGCDVDQPRNLAKSVTVE